MKNYRHITTLLVLAGALGASGCGGARFTPTTAFNGRIIDFGCLESAGCDHAHYCVGDSVTVTPKDGDQYHFKSVKNDGEVNESDLTHDGNGYLRGTTEYLHHGNKAKHWLIVVPAQSIPWKITVCNKDPGTGATCSTKQHAGYGHADD